ncbi:MAG: cupin-like domain-containing protein [Lautropia sp.]
MKQLDPAWWQWLAENRLLDAPVESIFAIMQQQGFERETCERAVAELDAHPVTRAARHHQLLQRKLESVVGNFQQVWQSAPGWETIEKRTTPSREEFLAGYVAGCRPVVLIDLAADWPARERWQPLALGQRFAELPVEIQDSRESDPRFEENKEAHRRTVRFGDFVDRIVAQGASNDCYLTANNELLKRPEFGSLFDDVGSLPDYVDRKRLATSSFFWIGPRGTRTPLHHDTVMLFHTQVVGRKRWRFVSPLDTANVYNYNGVFSRVDLDAIDLQRHPRMQGVRVLDVVVEAGETIYLPLGWWHQVTALDVSVSLSFTCLDIKNDYRFQDPTMRHW